MKTIITTLVAIGFVCSQAISQDKPSTYELEVKGNAAETWLIIEDMASELVIEGVSGSKIKIQAKDYKGLPAKAAGLKPLSASGPENTGIGLHLKQEGNTIRLSAAHNEANDAEYRIQLPKNLKLKLEYNSWQADDVLVKGMAGEIEAKSQVGDLRFENVTGPLVAYTLSSDLEVVFSEISSDSPTSLNSTSGDIDVTIPESTKATFKMATVSGGVYTAFDFDLGESKPNMIGGQAATGELNGGGVEVLIKSVSGDVYIRKP